MGLLGFPAVPIAPRGAVPPRGTAGLWGSLAGAAVLLEPNREKPFLGASTSILLQMLD